MPTFGGDEVSALVFDIGSNLTKVGYAGEDAPKAVFPTHAGVVQSDSVMDVDSSATSLAERKSYLNQKYLLGDDKVYRWRENMDIINPFAHGTVENWEALEAVWEYAYSGRLRTDSTQHPLLFSECPWNSKETREKLCELAFEKFNVPAFYLAKSPVLAAFSSGRSNALVVDSGASMTSVVPVYDAYVLKKGIQKQAIAGDFLSEQARLYLKEERNLDIVPQYQVKKKQAVDAEKPAVFELNNTPNTTPSFHQFNVARALHVFKETALVGLESPYDERIATQKPKKTYEFPNGFNTSLGKLRYKIPEVLFNPRYILKPDETTAKFSAPAVGIQQLAHASVQQCDPDIRTQMYTNVVLTGGNTLLPGFADRLHYELNILAPGVKVRLHAAGSTVERRFGAWVGGSILASLGTFHQLWISKKEYEEHGVNIIEKR